MRIGRDSTRGLPLEVFGTYCFIDAQTDLSERLSEVAGGCSSTKRHSLIACAIPLNARTCNHEIYDCPLLDEYAANGLDESLKATAAGANELTQFPDEEEIAL